MCPSVSVKISMNLNISMRRAAMTTPTRRYPRTRRVVLGATAGLAVLALAACGGNVGGGGDADGSDFPTGPVTISVGQEAGGSTDLIARAVAEGMADDLGVAVPVVNRAGANGALATEEVA